MTRRSRLLQGYGGAFRCMACREPLTSEEVHYYTVRCENCERAWSDRMTAYRNGAADSELDAMFDSPAETMQ